MELIIFIASSITFSKKETWFALPERGPLQCVLQKIAYFRNERTPLNYQDMQNQLINPVVEQMLCI
jgi:hypothetical protein